MLYAVVGYFRNPTKFERLDLILIWLISAISILVQLTQKDLMRRTFFLMTDQDKIPALTKWGSLGALSKHIRGMRSVVIM